MFHRTAVPHAAPLTPEGYTPAQIRHVYGFDNIRFAGGIPGDGRGTTIAIVDAFDNPTIVNDLKVFDKQFGLPDPPSFRVVNQRGSSSLATLPPPDQGWAGEITLDVEWAHAIAPAANILLVEATDNSFANLITAVDFARKQPGVVVVSNSYGGLEGLGENALDPYYTTPSGHPGVAFTVSAGDAGGPANYPSASPNVLSIGGTALKISPTGNWGGETVWNEVAKGAGSGGGGESKYLVQYPGGPIFSAFPLEPAPAFQKGLGLTGRGTPDVSYNADPYTGVACYSEYAFGGWFGDGSGFTVGGTSAGAPQWAALIAIADQGRTLVGKNSLVNPQAIMYSLPRTDFHDITVGNNDYLGFGPGITGNAAKPGYDLASGLGTPIANLVVRDLVAASGISFVSAVGAAGGGPASGFFRTRVKAFELSASELAGVAQWAPAAIGFGFRDDSSADAISTTHTSAYIGVSRFDNVQQLPNQSSLIAGLPLRGHHTSHANEADPADSLDSCFADLNLNSAP